MVSAIRLLRQKSTVSDNDLEFEVVKVRPMTPKALASASKTIKLFDDEQGANDFEIQMMSLGPTS